MKVYISKYRDHWISPYTMLDYAFWWTDWSRCSRDNSIRSLEDEKKCVEHPAWVERWSDRLLPVSRAIAWVLDCVHPPINYIKIDHYDTWSMDSTLSPVILPMLKQLKAVKHGSPHVDDEDVPENLRSAAAPAKENDWDTDGNHFARWDWVLDEIIWTFEQTLDDNGDSQFYSGTHDHRFVPVDADNNEVPRGEHKYFRMDDGPNSTWKVDREGLKAWHDRRQRGFVLFGKYYQSLWD